jgi:regulator of protease activity HflC (stomatin/prohibitin superfamily)
MIFELDLAAALILYFVVLIGIPIIIFLFISCCACKVVKHQTVMVVERFGKFHRACRSDNGFGGTGLHFLIPCMDSPRAIKWRRKEIGNRRSTTHEIVMRTVDLREQLMDFEHQKIITRDNVEITVHPMIVFNLFDPVRVAYETFDLSHAVMKLVQTTLRSIIGDMGLDDTLASREEIQQLLLFKIKKTCQNWGLMIINVELLEVFPNDTVQQAMHKQLSSERVRRAAIVTAHGFREQVKTIAEGQAQSKIALATGKAEVKVQIAKGIAKSKTILANAEAEALRIIAHALRDYQVSPAEYTIALKYINIIKIMVSRVGVCKVYLPYESDLMAGIQSHSIHS